MTRGCESVADSLAGGVPDNKVQSAARIHHEERRGGVYPQARYGADNRIPAGNSFHLKRLLNSHKEGKITV